MTQFAFLQPEFSEVFAAAKQAEDMAISNPRGACFYARLALETAVDWMYENDASLKSPYDTTLSALIHEGTFRRLVGAPILTKAKIIKDLGNIAAHDKKGPNNTQALGALRELFHFSYWLVRTYGRVKPDPNITFDPAAVVQTLTISASTVTQIQKLRADHDAHLKTLEEERKKTLAVEEARLKLEQDLAAAQAEIAAIKKANQAQADNHDYGEAQTRDLFIDVLLLEAGWELNPKADHEVKVFGMPNDAGEGFVDYVLWGDDGKPLAIIEAKRTKKDPQVGQQQAKLYADCLETQYNFRPIIFYTNGYEHWLWDDKSYPPRAVSGFYKKDELVLLHQRRGVKKQLEKIEIDKEIVERHYQTRAIRNIDDAFEKGNQRKALLVMATGSGKTRTVIALIDQLMRANWVKRALFLADRVALVNQSANAFKKHLPNAPIANLIKKHDKNTNDHAGARICVSTYPTMMGLIDEMQNGARVYGTGHFDLIVVDEAHRSIYKKYRAIFEYFDCLLVGLTATPKDEVDHDTYRLFEVEKGVPTDSYDLSEGVDDGYLVPPLAVDVPLKYPREGIKYEDLSEEEKEQWDALEWDEDGFIPDAVGGNDLNNWLFNIDTVDKVLEYLMVNGLKVDDGDKLGKTIVFCKNKEHAKFIVDRFNANYPHYKGLFARQIDYSVNYAQSLIDEFSIASSMPQIAVSVDMLDTGIDVPEVVNLVFFKMVRSKTKFWQMIGRGTRLCPDLFGEGQDKKHFLVFDFCENFKFFGENPEGFKGSNSKSLGELLFTRRVQLIGAGEGMEGLGAWRCGIIERLYEEVSGMTLDNFLVRQKRKTVEQFQDKANWNNLDEVVREVLIDELAGLPTAVVDNDLEAKQFDLLIFSTQLALLKQEKAFISYQKKIKEFASALENKANIPMVAKELELILAIQADDFWQDIDCLTLENIRIKLRLLAKLVDAKKRNIVYTDFEDEIGVGVVVSLPENSSGINKAQFEKKMQFFLAQHKDHIAIQKLRLNEQLTATDLQQLEDILVQVGAATREEIAAVNDKMGLGLFIRKMVGLDREAAKKAFSGFIESRNLNANQIKFIDMIINYLTQEGVMEPDALYESPFTDLNELGIGGVFDGGDAKEIIVILKNMKY